MKGLFSVDFKGIFRGLVFSILAAALALCLIFIAYSLVFNLVTSNPERVKDIIKRSSLYSDLPAELYDQAEKEAQTNQAEIPLKNPEIRQIALDVYSPVFVRSNTEKLIDGIYDWLEEDLQQPVINLDFSEKNKEFIGKVGNLAKKRAARLPPCSYSQIQSLKKFNVFSAKCLPTSITPSKIEKTVTNAKTTLLDDKFSTSDIKIDGEKPFYENFSDLPKSFSLAKSIPHILVVFALLIALATIYISENRVSGLKRISRTVFFAGILISLLPPILLSTGKSLLESIFNDDKAANITQTLFEQLMHDASKIYYTMGILLILIAAGMYFYARKIENDVDKIPKLKT